jgi:hypothetical protein
MKKSFIPFAGIFLVCILCAGIPAVAAENPNRSADSGATIKPAETSQPWYAPVTELFGVHQQDTTGKASGHPVNATVSQTRTGKAWWENLLPTEWIQQNSPQGTSSQIQTQNPAPVIAQDPDPSHPANPAPSPTPATPENQQKPQNSPSQKTP